MFFFLGCESKASFPVTHPGQFPGRLFPLAKGNPSVFSAGCITSLGFQQAHNFPNILIKTTSKQIARQIEGRELPGWGTVSQKFFFLWTYPEGEAHSSAVPYIPGIVSALMKIPTRMFFHSHSAHSLVLVLSHEMFSVKQKFASRCDWAPAVPWHWTAAASCKTHFPTQRREEVTI